MRVMTLRRAPDGGGTGDAVRNAISFVFPLIKPPNTLDELIHKLVRKAKPVTRLRHPESQASELQTRNPQCFVGPGLDVLEEER